MERGANRTTHIQVPLSSECLPADGMSAVAGKWDFGTPPSAALLSGYSVRPKCGRGCECPLSCPFTLTQAYKKRAKSLVEAQIALADWPGSSTLSSPPKVS